MGMTIDEALDYMPCLMEACSHCLVKGGGDKPIEKIDEAKLMVINIMRKYQKIQEVMDSRPDDDAKSNSKALGEIEVIMYGNDN